MTDADGFELLRNNLLTIGLIEPDTSAREVVELCMSFIIGSKEQAVEQMDTSAAMTDVLRKELLYLANSNYEKHAALTDFFC